MKDYIAYQNKSREALLQKVEITNSTQGDSFVFFHSHTYATRRALEDLVTKAYPDIEILSRTTIEGQNILVARTDDLPQNLITKLQEQSGETFSPSLPKKEKPKRDLIKLRGYIGVVAQFLMIGSGLNDSDKKAKDIDAEKKNRSAKIKTSAYGFLGNGINSVYGVQKEMDNTRLNYAKNLINKALGLRNGDDEKLIPKPSQTKRIGKAKDEPSFMEKNSIRVGSAIKLWSKVELIRAEGKDLKLSGWLSVIGKTISLIGLPEDHFQLEKKQDPITQMRRHSNFVSTLFDWTSTFSLFMGSFFRENYIDKNGTPLEKNEIKKLKTERPWYSLFDFKNSERRNLDNIQWWQLSGAIAFAASLFIKAIAPYTERKLDVDNLESHATLAIAAAVKKDFSEELTQVTAQMMQTRELPEIHKQGFARTFTDIANRLEQHHDIAIRASDDASPDSKQQQEMVDFVEEKSEERKSEKIAAIAKQKPKQKMTEHLTTAAVDSTLSTSM